MDGQIIVNAAAPKLSVALLRGVDFLHRAGLETARLDAEVLLGHALAMSRTELYVRFDHTLAPNDEAVFESLLERRAHREPVAYITGRREFWSLDIVVDRNVLIPRPETELLVEFTLARARKIAPGAALKILDIGTGSGAIAVALATELPQARVWATDISPAALAVARRNAQHHGVAQRLHFLTGDLFEPLHGQDIEFNLVVANPPYIASEELAGLAPEVRDYEPVAALDGGRDGLACYRRLVSCAPRFLAAGGSLLCEIGADQGAAVKDLFMLAGGFDAPVIYRDLAGKDRVVAAVKGGARG